MAVLKPYFSFLLIIVLLCSCAAHKDSALKQHIPPPQPIKQSQDFNQFHPLADLSGQRKMIVQHAINSLGLPYKWGGLSPQTGFDCSGLTVYTHKKANIIIQRTTRAQFKKGKILSKKDLQPADLVFFENPRAKKAFHVGIYIGDGIFVHAPGKGRQVTYAYLDNPYFIKYYIGSRSYL
ncbi:MAG: C40 family peptidase [Desulfobacteraceae bacterium]|nr:C40 family peptidase [Desulfobacteraceae bacterium]